MADSLATKIRRIKQGLSPIQGSGVWPFEPGTPSDRGGPNPQPRPILGTKTSSLKRKRKSDSEYA